VALETRGFFSITICVVRGGNPSSNEGQREAHSGVDNTGAIVGAPQEKHRKKKKITHI